MFKKSFILQITTQRSGSTWLLDLLRSHPDVTFTAHSHNLNKINEIWNRYPGGLTSENKNNNQLIEIRQGIYNFIPNFNSKHITFFQTKYFIEKIHPFFFNFNIKNITNILKQLRNKFDNVKLIYQTRDPQSSLSSFVNYQKRDPTWAAHLKTNNDVLESYLSNLKSINDIQNYFPGIKILYKDLKEDTKSTLLKIYDYLWPTQSNLNKIQNNKIAISSLYLTKRNIRLSPENKFLGINTKQLKTNYNNILLNDCVKTYNKFQNT
jgi:hypothetical protein